MLGVRDSRTFKLSHTRNVFRRGAIAVSIGAKRRSCGDVGTRTSLGITSYEPEDVEQL